MQSRQQFYKQLREQTNLRRSKFVSEEHIRNSIKTSSLDELEEVRKKLLEKKRREFESDEEEEDEDDVDMSEGEKAKREKMMELLDQEEQMCEQDEE